jgi:lipopolysaccharide/colanic/teichoic acid biosynthesis glycosyltransferase
MYSALHRSLNWGFGAVLFALGLPLMAGIAGLIWLTEDPPVLFTQTRAGHEGSPFQIIKFRTLRVDASGTTSPSEHTTRIGAVLRRWGLDELPQLWNVLRGEMNLIGPRPVLPAEARGYDERARRRLAVRPGITGWAQVNGRNNLDWSQRMDLDLWYVRNRSLELDLWILLQTPAVLLSGEGVYGPGTEDPSSDEVTSHLHR